MDSGFLESRKTYPSQALGCGYRLIWKSARSETSSFNDSAVKMTVSIYHGFNIILSPPEISHISIGTDWNLKTIGGFVHNQYMICDTNLLKNPLSHQDTPVFSVNFTFKLIIAGSDTINCQIFQSWFYLKVELGKRINLVSDWEEGLTQ